MERSCSSRRQHNYNGSLWVRAWPRGDVGRRDFGVRTRRGSCTRGIRGSSTNRRPFGFGSWSDRMLLTWWQLMLQAARTLNVAMVATAILLAVLVGVDWSKEAVLRGAYGFDLGYLPVAVGVSRVLSTRLAGVSRKEMHWLRILVPIVPAFVFEALAALALNHLHQELSLAGFLSFALFSTLMLLTVLILLVSFKYELGFGPFTAEERKSWRKGTLTVAILLGVLIVWEPARHFPGIGISRDIPPPNFFLQLVALESWFYKCSLMLFLYLNVLTLFPTLQNRLLGPGGADGPDAK